MSQVELQKCVIALAGPPLMGKNTIGQELQKRTNLTYIDIDVFRDWYMPDRRRTGRLIPGWLETAEMFHCYTGIHLRAAYYLLENKPISVGATYSHQNYVNILIALTNMSQTPLRMFLFDAPDEAIEERILTRAREGNPSVIKSVDQARELRQKYNRPKEVNLVDIDTSLSVEENIQQILDTLKDLRVS